MSDINARTICNMLEARAESNQHVFFDEVSNYGKYPTKRIDAIAMKVGYTKLQLWGYEIKVSRRDFVQDEKWHDYLDMCNSLYFVCPHGVITKDEVPAQCGLMYVTKNGSMIRTVKKAPYRKVEYRPTYFMGMIFNKCNVMDVGDRETRLKKAIKLQSIREDAVQVGLDLGSKLALQLDTQRRKQEEQDRRMEQLEEVEAYLNEEKIFVSGRRQQWGSSPVEQLRQRRNAIMRDQSLSLLINDLDRTSSNLNRMSDRLQQAQRETEEDNKNEQPDDADGKGNDGAGEETPA